MSGLPEGAARRGQPAEPPLVECVRDRVLVKQAEPCRVDQDRPGPHRTEAALVDEPCGLRVSAR